GLDHFRLVGGAGQIHVHCVLHDRHGDDEHDKEHQHDVHQGRHVDFVHDIIAVVLGAEGHDLGPFLQRQYFAVLVAGGVDRHAGTCHKESVHVVCKAVQATQHALVAAHDGVVAQYCRNGHSQTEGGHDQRLANRASHLVDR